MDIKKVNEIAKTKYKNIKIYQKGEFKNNKIAVVFDETNEESKVYFYNATNYIELLGKIGINNIIYKKDMEAYQQLIENAKKALAENGKKDEYFGDNVILTNEEIEHYNYTISYYTELLKNSIVV